MVDARLPNGGRLNAIISPLAVDGPMVSIRKFRKDPFTPDELLAKGTFDAPMQALLKAMVLGRCNILVSGGTSSGKTSLLNALASYVPPNERVITVEDTAELPWRSEHPRPGAQQPAHAAGPHRGRRSPWRRGAGNAAGDEHRPRRLDGDHPFQFTA
ncbi:hypothetical protein G6F63_014787 [Rhizopus arrhizus]|nr:hypothetical protein G6F63_014787 [Rhizopus arrhizus]